MFLMMAEILHLSRVARSFPGSGIWEMIGFHTSHVEWFGCSLHDLIQPSFSFLVGVVLPFSMASRVARGDSMGAMVGHVIGQRRSGWGGLVHGEKGFEERDSKTNDPCIGQTPG